MSRTHLRAAALFGMLILSCRAQEGKHDLEFEVVSIKLAPPPVPFSAATRPPAFGIDRFIQTSTLKALILEAYGPQDLDGLSGPAWMDSARYAIEATYAAGATQEEVKAMLRKMLADRFGLRLHYGRKTEPVYELYVDNTGLKLKAAGPDADAGCASRSGQIFCKSVTMEHLAAYLRGAGTTPPMLAQLTGMPQPDEPGIELPVIDRTGVIGRYYVDLQWTPPPGLPEYDLPNLPPRDRSVKAHSVFGAIEAAGLKLQKTKHAYNTLVIDSIDRTPSEN